MQIWLHLVLVLGLALVAWIGSIDATGGNMGTVAVLWSATAIGAAHVLLRFLRIPR